MNLSKTQFVIAAVASVVVLVFILILLGIIPGLQSSSTDPTKIKATLGFWGVGENADAYTEVFGAFNAIYPNVILNYRNFSDPERYETTLLDALASGQGPDIFMIRNTDLPGNRNKITPVRETRFSASQLNQIFPQVVARDFVYQNGVYALPVSIDTLALIYNRSIFDQAAAPLPLSWKSWDDFLSAIPKLIKTGAEGGLTQAAAAIGTGENVNHAADILYLLMLQNGVQLSDNQTGLASFTSDRAVQTLNFYSQFSNPKSAAYAWSGAMPNSLDAFANGKVAMIFDYSSNIPQIKSRNNFLNFEVAPLPQPRGATLAVSYPSYWGYAVSRQSVNQNLAWEFILTMTTNEAAAKGYVQRNQKPPALNSLIYQYQNDPSLGIFARQALTARSWLQLDGRFEDRAVSDMLESIASGKFEAVRATLERTENQINQYLRQKYSR